MIVIAGTVRIRADRRDQAVAAARAMAAATRRESGCFSYRFAFDIEQPDVVHVFEEWESIDALMRHFGTDHMKVFQRELEAMLAEAPRLHRFVVESVSPM